MSAELEVELDFDRARGAGARYERIESRVPRAAGMPYSAHAIASSSVDLPEPFGPMMPVMPASKSIWVSTCCRKFESAKAVEAHQLSSSGAAARRRSPALRRGSASARAMSTSRSTPASSGRLRSFSATMSLRSIVTAARRAGAVQSQRRPGGECRDGSSARAACSRESPCDRARARCGAARRARRRRTILSSMPPLTRLDRRRESARRSRRPSVRAR